MIRLPRPSLPGLLPLAALLVMTAIVSAATPQEARLEPLRQKHATLRHAHAAETTTIAGELDRAGAFAAAAEARSLALPPDPRQIVLNRLPRAVAAEPSLELPTAERELQRRLRQSCADYSTELYQLSRQALATGSVRYAHELLREAAVQDPDNAAARRMLGFQRSGDEWMTPFEYRMRQRRLVWHDRFGWLPADHVARYEAGERYYNGRWISAEEEAELRRDFNNAWTIRTEHYLVKTNHSLERGVAVATRLEEFRDFFVEAFAGFFTRPEELNTLFRGTAVRSAASDRPYEVHYYRDREEYNRRLKPKISLIEMTNGLYYTTDRIAYFFHDDKAANDDTLYHEATHQLMYESLPREREIATQANFWVIEGIACYMESFRPGDGVLSLGDREHVRIRAARYRFLNDKYHVPLGRLAAMGLHEFQTVPRDELSKNYSEASGLAHFFMHYDGGRYRDALVEHLAQLYHGSGPNRRLPKNLAELTGVAYQTLDREYGEYLRSLGEPQAAAARD